jgi:DNA-binding CsgD family transcriptional regulator
MRSPHSPNGKGATDPGVTDRRELRASGATAPRRRAAPGTDLTAREAQIAKLASGLSNGETAVRLFVSSRTVAYHLHKIFAKTGITSRHALATDLPRGTTSGETRSA